MPTVRTRITLEAPASRVWLLLTEFRGFSRWNQVITKAEGIARVGQRISFRIHIAPLPALPIVAKIVAAEPEKHLAWRGGKRGVFVGEHSFFLEESGGETELIHEETFQGKIAELAIPPLTSHIQNAYATFNSALAQACR